TGSGTLLRSGTFTDETEEGWQQVIFGEPVPIVANTTYVASYHTDVGSYAANQGYFASAGVARWPLRVLADGEDGPNGVFKYGASAFPDEAYMASNYWVDVIFSPGQGAVASP